MRVLLLSVGTRGDLEPFCAIAHELCSCHDDDDDCASSGCQVELFAQKNLISLASHLERRTTRPPSCRCRLRLHALPFTNQDYYQAVGKSQSSQSNFLRQDPRMKSVGQVADIISHLVLPCYNRVEEVLLRNHDTMGSETGTNKDCVIVTSFLARPLAFLLAKIHRVPVVVLNFQPIVPNNLFPNYRVSVSDFVQAIINHDGRLEEHSGSRQRTNMKPLSEDDCFAKTYWKLEHALEFNHLHDKMESLIQEISKRRVDSPNDSVWYTWKELQQILLGHNDQFLLVNAYSNHLVPSVADFSSPRVIEVGPLADSYVPPGTPPRALVDFLNQHTPTKPICVGFGSMAFPDPQIVLRALASIGHPAILVGKCLRVDVDGQDDAVQHFVKSHIYFASNLPYAWLLERCSMMLCHGGAGVVNACLRAGIPCIVAPVMGDQHAWGALLEAKGLGVLLRKRQLSDLTTIDIVNSIQRVFDDEDNNIQERCRRLGATIRHQTLPGAKMFVKILEDRIVQKRK